MGGSIPPPVHSQALVWSLGVLCNLWGVSGDIVILNDCIKNAVCWHLTLCSMTEMYLPDDTDVPVSTVDEGSIISQKTEIKTCVDLEGGVISQVVGSGSGCGLGFDIRHGQK